MKIVLLLFILVIIIQIHFNILKFFRYLILLVVATFFCLSSWAEIIDSKKIINKDFDVWRVSCEEDEMLGKMRCRLFVEVTSDTTFFVIPNENNKILIISKDGYYGKSVFIKVDNNKLLASKSLSDLKYGAVEFSKTDLDLIFKQMQTGKFVYLRFYIKDKVSVNGYKEMTVKFSLNEFKNALDYYNKQIKKY